MNSILKKVLLSLIFIVLTFLCVGNLIKVNATSFTLISWTRANALNTITSGYTLSNNLTSKDSYYQDSSADATYYFQIKSDSLLFDIEPISVSLTVNLGGGTIKNFVEANYIYAAFVNASDEVIGEPVLLSTAITTTTGSDFTISLNTTTAQSAYGVKIYHLKLASYNVRYYSMTLSYEASVASVGITSSVSNIKVGETSDFVATSANIDNPTAATWNSSNTDAATIDSNGKLTAVAMGKTNIVATISEIESSAVAVTVWPSNSSSISIETALSICSFTGNNESFCEYTCVGTVKSVTSTSIFVITDGTNDITVYKSSHGKAVNDVVRVTGKLINYSETTKEFSSPTITNLYTITFDSNGGSSVSSYTNLESGTVITEPTAPTKTNYTFLGWYNNGTQWNFSSNTVSSNITLTAKWLLTSLYTSLNNISAYMNLAYKYSTSASTPSDTLTSSSFTATSTTYTDFSNVSATSYAKYVGNTSKTGSSAISIRSTNSNSGIITTVSGGKATKITVVWDSATTTGRIIDIYGSNTAYTGTDASILYGSNKGTKLGSITYGTSTELEIEGDYAFIGIRSNNGALYLTSIQIDWSGTAYTNDDFRIRCGIDKSISTVASNFGNGAVYGIEVSDGTTTKKYASNNSLFISEDAENGKSYVIIDLGAVLNNISRLDTEFTVRAYVTYGDDTYYSSSTKTYSIVSIMQAYIDLNDETTNSLIAGFKVVLESLGYSFTGGQE